LAAILMSAADSVPGLKRFYRDGAGRPALTLELLQRLRGSHLPAPEQLQALGCERCSEVATLVLYKLGLKTDADIDAAIERDSTELSNRIAAAREQKAAAHA
jgi:hypothetical protein